MRPLRWFVASGFRVAVAIALIVGAYHATSELWVLTGRPFLFLQRLELSALDLKFALRGPRPPKEWRVAVAAVDRKAIRRFGPLPWPRAIHARLVERLSAMGARSIAFDMTFERPTRRSEQVERLERTFREGRLEETEEALGRTAERIEQAAKRLRRVRRPRALRRQASNLSGAAKRVRAEAERIGRLREGFFSQTVEDPDGAFANAISRSGRVILGVVGLSEREMRSLALNSADARAALALASSSTISEIPVATKTRLEEVLSDSVLFERGRDHRFSGLVPPTLELAVATRHFALINTLPDADGVDRRLPLVSGFQEDGVLLPTLALQAVSVALGESTAEVVQRQSTPVPPGIRLPDRSRETVLRTTRMLDWYGSFDAGAMPIFSVADLLDKTMVLSDLVDGRAVFVAATAIGTRDRRVTPLERAVPGVYIHATLAQNLFDRRRLVRPLQVVLIELGFILLIGLAAGIVMTRVPLAGKLIVAFSLALGWAILDRYLLFERGLVVYTVLPIAQVFLTLMAVSISGFLVDRRAQRNIRAVFGRCLSPPTLEAVLSEPEPHMRLGGCRYDATVLFSSIRGFTSISEQLRPEMLGRLLDQYMTRMTDIVFHFEGTLERYVGDALMAFWGAPIAREDHPLLACRASLAMISRVEELNVRFSAEGLPRIAVGIGLSSGPMTIGNMGSGDHFAYTALGDYVDFGARLEGQTKEYGVNILIGESVWEAVHEEMLCRQLDLLRVEGRREPVRVFELLGARAQNAHRNQFVRTFHGALASFRSQNWVMAMELFQRARVLAGPDGDRASDLYLQWTREYQESPPPLDWDGVRTTAAK